MEREHERKKRARKKQKKIKSSHGLFLPPPFFPQIGQPSTRSSSTNLPPFISSFSPTGQVSRKGREKQKEEEERSIEKQVHPKVSTHACTHDFPPFHPLAEPRLTSHHNRAVRFAKAIKPQSQTYEWGKTLREDGSTADHFSGEKN